jgi:NAD(P)-dependent dehydrogenase (short-subunit alcohol dehydrogenase family)
MSYDSLKGRTYIVTGAASGMGKAISILLARQGANVGLFDLSAPVAVEEIIQKGGGQCIALAVDVQDPKAVDEGTKAVVSKFGGLHGIVCDCELELSLKPSANSFT